MARAAIRYHAARTRRVSAAGLAPTSRRIVTQIQLSGSRTDSLVRILHAQPGSRSARAPLRPVIRPIFPIVVWGPRLASRLWRRRRGSITLPTLRIACDDPIVDAPRLFCSAGQNVDEAHHCVRADEFADALDQKNHSEQTEKNQLPCPDRGLNHPPDDDEQKRDRPDSNGQCSKPVHAGSGIKTTHVQLPRGARRQRAVKDRQRGPRNGPRRWRRLGNRSALPVLLGRRPACGTCYFAPNICWSTPELCDAVVINEPPRAAPARAPSSPQVAARRPRPK